MLCLHLLFQVVHLLNWMHIVGAFCRMLSSVDVIYTVLYLHVHLIS